MTQKDINSMLDVINTCNTLKGSAPTFTATQSHKVSKAKRRLSTMGDLATIELTYKIEEIQELIEGEEEMGDCGSSKRMMQLRRCLLQAQDLAGYGSPR